MSLARTTIGISRVFENMTAGRPGRRGVLVALITMSAFLVIVAGLMFVFGQPLTPIIGVVGLILTILTFSLMIVRHEWLLMLGIIAGHTLFYGKFPSQLGLRVKDSVGPGDLLFFLAFIAGLVYWLGSKEKPVIPKSILIVPLILFLFTAGYILVAFFFWKRQDNALSQATGWLYFIVAAPTHLCLTTGRAWKPFFAIIMLSLLGGAILSTFIELGLYQRLISITGYGGLGQRSYGDLSVKTNMLAMALTGTLVALVVLGYAKNFTWRALALVAALSGIVIIFLDRGRIHYAGLAASMVIVVALMSPAPRIKTLSYLFISIFGLILLIQVLGGETQYKFNQAAKKAYERVLLTSKQAVIADKGLNLRQMQLWRARAEFNEAPIFGKGPGVRFGWEFDWQSREMIPVTFIDNSWLYPLAVGGIFSMALILICYGTMVGATWWAYARLRHPVHKSLAIIPTALLVFLLVCSPVTWWLVDRYHIATFAIMTAATLAFLYHERVNGSDEPIVAF